MSLSAKLSALFLCLFLATVMVTAFVGYTSLSEMVEDQIRMNIEDHTIQIMDKIDRMLFERYADMRILSTDPIIMSRDSTPAEITDRLKQVVQKYEIYSSISFFDLDRVRIADTSGGDIGVRHVLTDYWREIGAGREFVVAVSRSQTTGRVIIHCLVVVKDANGKPFGVLASRLPAESIYEMAEHTLSELDRALVVHVELLDRNGLILYSNYNTKGILKEKSSDHAALGSLLSSGMNTGSLRHSYGGEEELTAFAKELGYRTFKGNGWALVLCLPVRTAFAPVYTVGKMFAGLFTGMGILAFSITFIVSRRLVRPLQDLVGTVAEVGKGNLDVRADVTSEDEVGQLAQAFNKMVGNRGRIENELRESELRYRNLFNAVNDGIMMIDLQGLILEVNDVVCSKLGYSRDELLQMTPRDFDAPEFAETVPERLAEIRRSGSCIFETAWVSRDGKTISIEISARAIEYKGIPAILSIARDITERKLLEHERRRLEGELRIKLDETERLNKLMVGRELKMEELKGRIRELESGI